MFLIIKMNPLPPIVPVPIALPPAVPVAAPVAAVPVFSAIIEVVKKFILFITKDMTPEDLALFKTYNLVEYEDSLHKNLPINSFEWDVLVFDLREKADRYAVSREVLPYRNLYNLVVYCHKFEMDDVDVDYDNIFAKFPERQASKIDFEKLLLMKRISKPRWYVSLFNCLASVYQKTKA